MLKWLQCKKYDKELYVKTDVVNPDLKLLRGNPAPQLRDLVYREYVNWFKKLEGFPLDILVYREGDCFLSCETNRGRGAGYVFHDESNLEDITNCLSGMKNMTLESLAHYYATYGCTGHNPLDMLDDNEKSVVADELKKLSDKAKNIAEDLKSMTCIEEKSSFKQCND